MPRRNLVMSWGRQMPSPQIQVDQAIKNLYVRDEAMNLQLRRSISISPMGESAHIHQRQKRRLSAFAYKSLRKVLRLRCNKVIRNAEISLSVQQLLYCQNTLGVGSKCRTIKLQD